MATEKESAKREAMEADSNSSSSDDMASQPKPGFTTTLREVTTADRSSQHLYITGLRGIVVIQSFLWTYFHTFIPTLTSNSTPGPVYQDLLREIFSVPLWNDSFIYNFFVILSMRTIAVSFLQNPTGQTYAATVIRRIVRMVLILCIASGLATAIFSQIGVEFIEDFKTRLPNQSIQTPVKVYDAIAAWNSLFDLFWITTEFFSQAANTFWPTHTLWVPSIIYFQSFTVYFIMVILPFTRPQWHLKGLFLFGFGSFWMGFWGWYSVTGLYFADLAINPILNAEFKAGYKVKEDWHIPYWAAAIASFGAGIAFKYTFVVRPQFVNSLLYLHPYLDLSEMTSRKEYIDMGPYARLDDWLVIVGILIAVELFSTAQWLLSFKPLVWLGERSFSIFFAQCVFFWTGGIKLWLALYEKDVSTAGANAVVFIVGLLAVAVLSELFWRIIDLPSRWIAKWAYTWLVN